MGRPKGSKDKQKRKKRTGPQPNHFTAHLSPNVKDVVAATCKKEEISRIVGESAQFFGRPKVADNEDMANRLNEYFKMCYDVGQIPTVEDMCLSLGITRQIMTNWITRDAPRNPDRARMLQQAREVLAAIDAKLVSEGKIPQVTYIFRAKNYFDMKDQQDVVIAPNVDLMNEAINEEKLRQKYLENVFDGTDVQKVLKEPVPEIVTEVRPGVNTSQAL